MTDVYHDGHRKLQEAFGVKPMADRLAKTIIQSTISPEDQKYIEKQNMFFWPPLMPKAIPVAPIKAAL